MYIPVKFWFLLILIFTFKIGTGKLLVPALLKNILYFGDKGQRAFFVSPSIEKLFKCIMNTPLNLRHYYELIPQFENCNLYLDIDFKLPPEKAEENKRNKQLYKNNLIDRIIIDEVKTHLKKTHPQVSEEIDNIEPLFLFSYQYNKKLKIKKLKI
ncbi:hypothetical protein ACTFIY_011451 [Dictyostelium cf. discoideum]